MQPIIATIKAAKRKAFLKTKPMYDVSAPVTEEELARVTSKLGATLPAEVSESLLALGYGTLNDQFNISRDWWNVLDRGELAGHVVFAQDESGNLYTLSLGNGDVHFIDRFAKTYAWLAGNFIAFLEEASSRGFQIMQWSESQPQRPYDTGA